MRIFKPKEEKPSELQPLIDEIISEMAGYDAPSEEYQTLLSSLRVLLEAKANEPKPKELSPDTAAIVAGNLAGVALILLFEMKTVINSRALGMINKPKI